MVETTVLWTTAALNVIAILAAPITALWVQGKRDESKAQRERRDTIFKALWVNRRRQSSVARVDALNMVDVEFFGERQVQDAWQALFAHYCNQPQGLNEEQIFREREELFATLLFEISQVLGYKFTRTHIRDNIYHPTLHGKIDQVDLETRVLFNELLKKDALPIRFVTGPPAQSVPPPQPPELTGDGPTALRL
jgi:hypothetical protein